MFTGGIHFVGVLVRLRRGLYAFVAVLALVGAGLWTHLGGASATTSNPDTIVYSQVKGNSGTYLQYVPGDGSKPTTQAITAGGGCSTPRATNPVLAFSANYYPNGYQNAPTPAIVGAYNNRTGVCQIGQAWSIEVGEGLDFAPGPNPLTAGRLFVEATLILEREDKASTGNVTGQLVETLGGQVVGTTPFSIGPNGAPPVQVDTGKFAMGFDKLEVQVLSPATGSVSVVGPTSNFTLATNICPGTTVTQTSTDGTLSSGQVTASFTYVAGSGCKALTKFAVSANDPSSSSGKSIEFDSQQLLGAHVTASFDWGYFPYCRADSTVQPGVPPCPTTQVDFGSGFQPETYCSAANPPATPPVCVTSRNVNYIPDPGGSGLTVAHITETWDLLGDTLFRH